MWKVNLGTIFRTQSDTLSILYLVVTKGSRHGARCGKLILSASIAKRGIAQGGFYRKDTALSFNDFKITIYTANLHKLLGGPKTLADMWTRKQNKIGLTLPRGARGNGTKTTGSLP